MSDDDLVQWLLRTIQAEAAGGPLTSDVVIRTEHLARVHWGGARPYIAKRPTFVRLGEEVPKSTYYRWMKRSPRRQRG